MRVLFRLSLAASVVLLFGIYFSCGSGGTGSGTTYFADVDGDGFGDVNNSQILDEPQAGWVLDSTDCDDNLVGGYSINPNASEVCDDWADNES